MSGNKADEMKKKSKIYIIVIAITCLILLFLSINPVMNIFSIRKIDDHPLFLYNYHGGYWLSEIIFSAYMRNDLQESDIGCASFYIRDSRGDYIFAKNDINTPAPAMVIKTNRPGKYSTISVASLEWLIRDQGDIKLLQKIELLVAAPFIMGEGMNEEGLIISRNGQRRGGGPVHSREMLFDKNLKMLFFSHLMRKVLDNAKNVDEAIAIIRKYNIRTAESNSSIHFHLADSDGNSAVIEYANNSIYIIRYEKDEISFLTNNLISEIGSGEYVWDPQYNYLTKRLPEINLDVGFTETNAMEILEELIPVSYMRARWSTVFNLTQGTVQLAVNSEFEKTYEFELR